VIAPEPDAPDGRVNCACTWPPPTLFSPAVTVAPSSVKSEPATTSTASSAAASYVSVTSVDVTSLPRSTTIDTPSVSPILTFASGGLMRTVTVSSFVAAGAEVAGAGDAGLAAAAASAGMGGGGGATPTGGVVGAGGAVGAAVGASV